MPLKCGCTPDASGFGWCSECCRKLREKCEARLTPAQRAYDNFVDPAGYYQNKLDPLCDPLEGG